MTALPSRARAATAGGGAPVQRAALEQGGPIADAPGHNAQTTVGQTGAKAQRTPKAIQTERPPLP